MKYEKRGEKRIINGLKLETEVMRRKFPVFIGG